MRKNSAAVLRGTLSSMALIACAFFANAAHGENPTALPVEPPAAAPVDPIFQGMGVSEDKEEKAEKPAEVKKEEPPPLPAPPPPPPPPPPPAPKPEPTMMKERDQEDIEDSYRARERDKEARNKRERDKDLLRHEGSSNHFEIDYVLAAFQNYDFNKNTPSGTQGSNPGPAHQSSQGIILEWMYFPLVSKIGRFGIGPNLGVYRMKDNSSFSGVSPDFETFGAKAIYEFQFMVNQILVPFGVGGFDHVILRPYSNNQPWAQHVDPDRGLVGTGVSGSSFNLPYFGFGLAFNLNPLDWSSASDSLISSGIRKFYLVYTYENHFNSDPSLRSQTNLLGLRFEF